MNRKKKVLAAGLLAGLTAGAGAGFILESAGSAGASNVVATRFAADDNGSTTTTAPGTTSPGTAAAGSGSSSTSADPAANHDAEIRAALAGLVTAGTLSQDQVDKIVAALDQANVGMGGHGGGRGHGGPGGPGLGGPGLGGAAKLDTIATALGISTTDLQTALQGGQSIADVAKAHSVDVQKVIDALVAAEKTELDAQVKAGTITQAQADTHLADATTRITGEVNQAGGFGHGGPGGRGPGGNGGGRPNDNDADDTGSTTPTTAPATSGS